MPMNMQGMNQAGIFKGSKMAPMGRQAGINQRQPMPMLARAMPAPMPGAEAAPPPRAEAQEVDITATVEADAVLAKTQQGKHARDVHRRLTRCGSVDTGQRHGKNVRIPRALKQRARKGPDHHSDLHFCARAVIIGPALAFFVQGP